MEMCDLLEVYSSSEKETLKRTYGVYMKESELARSVVTSATNEETMQFVDMDTLRYQEIASQKVETIRLKAEQRKVNNNVIDQSAFYSDIESDDDDDSDDGDSEEGNDARLKNEQEGSESDEEEELQTQQIQKQEQNGWNKNKRVCKEEIDVDDI
jgi:hypothetical protein